MGFFINTYDNLLSFGTKLRSVLHDFYRATFAKLFFSFILLLNLVLWAFSYYIYNNLSQDRLILHYNVDIGIDLIGDRHDVFVIPVVSLLLIIINQLFLLVFFNKKLADFKFVLYFASSFLLLSQIFLFLAILIIYLINFS